MRTERDFHVNSYEEAVSYISGTPKFTSKNSMENTRLFLKILGNPGLQAKIVHVAGTNGKGSVCAYLRSVLRSAKLSCGMFISPHLVTMRERFVINDDMVSEEDFVKAFRIVMEKLSDLPEQLQKVSYHPTFFEFLFFMAMVLFEESGVEFIILETGLGGMLDATNSLPEKKVCVITSIGYDHMEILGNTLADIAEQKAGILRKDTPVVYKVGENVQQEVTDALFLCVKKTGAISRPLENTAIKDVAFHNKTIDFSLQLNYYGCIGFTVSTSAIYQIENAALAIKAIECLEDDRIEITHLQEGIQCMRWEGRMEEVCPRIYLDGAHNRNGIEAFLDTVRSHKTMGKRILLYSVVKDKQYEVAIRLLAGAGLFDVIAVAQLSDDRALPLEDMKKCFEPYTGFSLLAFPTVEVAYEKLKKMQGEMDTIYVAGSLYLVGEVKAFLRRDNHD